MTQPPPPRRCAGAPIRVRHGAIFIHTFLLGTSVSKPSSAVYGYIVRELASTEHASEEILTAIARQLLSVPAGTTVRGTKVVRLKGGYGYRP